MQTQVLVDSPAFKQRFEEVTQQAKNSVYVQAMSFEGDAAGEWLVDCMIKSPATDKRLCLDSYSKFVVNDHFVYSLKYFKDEVFRNEIKNTKRLITKAKSNGIIVKYTNPLGFLFLKYPYRNHKKIVVVDEQISYIGGINFCDHNFEWHDMMIEMQHKSIGASLADDVRKTLSGLDQIKKQVIDDTTLYYLDGLKSKSHYGEIFNHINEAKSSVKIISPYVSDPLLTYAREHLKEDVELEIISPAENNKNVFKTILTNELTKGYFKFFEYQGGMSHLKAILIDDEILIAGSSNFDFISYYFEQEVVIVSKNKAMVDDFINKILNPDKKNSIQIGVSTSSVVLSVPIIVGMIRRLCYLIAICVNFKRKLFR